MRSGQVLCTVFPHRETARMASLDTGRIIVIALASVLVVLLITVLVITLVMMKKRNLLCFKKNVHARPILLSDRELEARYGPKRKRKKSKNKAKSRKKEKVKYHSLGRLSSFPKSNPFANKPLENPLVDDEEFDMDWTNPAFDVEGGRLYDAAVIIQSWYRMIRWRTPFLHLRRAVVLAQAHYKGLLLRRQLPQLRREKQIRDQQRKKQTGWKKKGTLSALKFYEVKGYGFAEVEQLYGLEITRNAAEQLKKLYGGKGQMRLKLFISIKGIKLFDYNTMRHFATVNVASVSFCTLDPKNKKLFAFINRKKKRNFCHVFQANEQDAQKMVETMAEAFEVTFKRNERKREERELRERTRLSEMKKQAIHRQSQELSQSLDEEVASMMEMAETASITTPSLKRSSLSEASTVSDASSTGSGSRERLLAGNRPQSSGLLVSRKAPKEAVQAENFDPNKVDDYFTDIQNGVDCIANTLERERRSARLESKQQRDNSDAVVRPLSSLI